MPMIFVCRRCPSLSSHHHAVNATDSKSARETIHHVVLDGLDLKEIFSISVYSVGSHQGSELDRSCFLLHDRWLLDQ